ncbi:cytochrome c biogenesis protein CcsA [Amycolatopsis sp. NBC_00345]|uniref:heme lyase CcmF/NrfE family subunit n=1 Tax=Amycolatopsis sp. NBC_00345 TaxID=2975955 RepID=UPI002E2524BD
MDVFGRSSLFLALAATLWSLFAAVCGGRRPALVESARTSCFAVLPAVVAANGAMLAALLTDDFAIRYVAESSSRAAPAFYKVLALWGGDAGSLLLWNLVLAGYSAALAWWAGRHPHPAVRWVLATMAAVQVFFLSLVVVATDPFAAASPVPADGHGLQPLLRGNVLMAVHPPMLYLGLIGFAVPFGFAVAALAERDTGDWWIRAARRWVLAAWCFLAAGLCLGALWAYSVLGWGGFWAWDPVENAALLPWLTATAYLHSARLQERRGVLRIWNLGLVITTFALTILGTFLTRGSLLVSVHSFAESAIGPFFLAFLGLVVVGGFALLMWRTGRLRSRGKLDAVLSRETFFLGNNLVLTVLAATVGIGTLYPLIVAAGSGAEVTVGKPFYEQATTPLLLLVLLLAGLAPLLPWRKAPPNRLLARLALPAAAGVLAVAGLRLAGATGIAAPAGFGLAVFTMVAAASELVRSARGRYSRRGAAATALVTAVFGRAVRRSHGALLAHVGLAVAAGGIAASAGLAAEAEATLVPGQSATLVGYRVTYVGAEQHVEPDRTTLSARLVLEADARQVAELSPSISSYRGATDPVGEPAIRHGIGKDLYATLLAVQQPGNQATLRLYVNPGVSWFWAGGALVVLGGFLSGWPVRRTAPSRAAREVIAESAP